MIIISNRINKPKKNAEELVKMLEEEKGILFTIIDTDAAIDHLTSKNNYLRTASYRKNYRKHQSGENEGKYINLEFAYLAELSKLDMCFRDIVLKMCIDIEHDLKVILLSETEKLPEEDGYNIVNLFLKDNPQIVKSIESKIDTIFTGDLINKYFKINTVIDFDNPEEFKYRIVDFDCPIWVLVELITFGDTIKLYEFFKQLYPASSIINLSSNIMKPVKSLRNACAHNNCLLNSLEPSKATQPPHIISQYVTNIHTIGKEERMKKLSSRPLFEFTCMIYLYDKIVSQSVKLSRIPELEKIICQRFYDCSEYYRSNQLISTSFSFLKKIVNNLVKNNK